MTTMSDYATYLMWAARRAELQHEARDAVLARQARTRRRRRASLTTAALPPTTVAAVDENRCQQPVTQ